LVGGEFNFEVDQEELTDEEISTDDKIKQLEKEIEKLKKRKD
jgi:hypothetical protein